MRHSPIMRSARVVGVKPLQSRPAGNWDTLGAALCALERHDGAEHQEAPMIPDRYAPQAYAVMRIVFGVVYLMYGLQKFGMLGGQMAPLFSYPFGIAAIIEVVAGVLIIVGLGTKIAAFVASGEMAVAYWTFHVPMGSILPVQNNGQPAVLFCFAFLYFATRGSGIWSVDGVRK